MAGAEALRALAAEATAAEALTAAKSAAMRRKTIHPGTVLSLAIFFTLFSFLSLISRRVAGTAPAGFRY